MNQRPFGLHPEMKAGRGEREIGGGRVPDLTAKKVGKRGDPVIDHHALVKGNRISTEIQITLVGQAAF